MRSRRVPGSAEPTLYLRRVSLERDRVPSFDEYPFSLPAIRGLAELELSAPVTFLVGENGAGKSTLLEAIAVGWGLNAEGGSRNLAFATRPSHSPLHGLVHLSRTGHKPYDSYFLRAESFYNVATQVERDERADRTRMLFPPILEDYGGARLHEQSHGESFFTLLTERLGGGGLYLMDEPEAALSPTRQMAALVRFRDLVRLRSQLIVATHSPILMAYPGADILHLDENGIRRLDYEDTEHYVVTREFLNRPEAMIRELFAE
jgi:predicted ATPase